jgi:hypothetical protein
MAKLVMHIYGWAALAVTVAGLAAMLIMPPASGRADRNGVPYFTPKVLNPATGEAVPMDVLVRHYRGQ